MYPWAEERKKTAMPAVMEAIDRMTSDERVKTMEYLWAAMTASATPALPARTRYVLIEIDDVSPNKLASIEEVEIQSAAWGD